MLPVVNPAHTLQITIRPARPEDRPALWRLAALDSATVPAEPLLVAELDGELSVAVSASGLRAIADPFVPTAHIVQMVRDHVRRTMDEPQPRMRLRRRLAPALSLRAA